MRFALVLLLLIFAVFSAGMSGVTDAYSAMEEAPRTCVADC